jgi:Uncharacterized protein conserved in bacteria
MKLNDNARARFKLTDAGYLISEGVKLARTGPMEYLGSDLGKEENKIYDVYVNEDELFSPDTIKSFENVPITINHPEEMEVNSKNWEELTKGTIVNVRPSEDRKFLLGDAIINSANAIKTIQDGTSEVSCGYDADIETINGKLTKVNIRGNHLAVLDEGRCGSECKLNLNDGKPKEMTKKRTMLDKILGRKPKKSTSVKFGDAKIKLNDRKKKLNDAKADFDKKLADAEEVVLSADATTEEKAAAVQELQAEAASLTEEAQAVLDDAQAATAQAEELASQIEEEVPATTVTDEDTAAAAAELADLEAQLQEKDAKIAQLEEENKSLKDAEDNSATLGDAKASFPKVAFKDGMSARQAKAAAVASTGSYTVDQALKLQDCALNSAYAAAKTMQIKKPEIGKKFVGNDSKSEPKVPASLRNKGAK